MDIVAQMQVKKREMARHSSELSKRHRLKKRANGLCGYNGCKVLTGTEVYYCPLHKEKVREAVKSWRRINETDDGT
jgi:hypothetical protein